MGVDRCPDCGANLAMVGKAHKCVVQSDGGRSSPGKPSETDTGAGTPYGRPASAAGAGPTGKDVGSGEFNACYTGDDGVGTIDKPDDLLPVVGTGKSPDIHDGGDKGQVAANRRWRAKNREHLAAYMREYRKRRRDTGGDA